MDDVFDENSTWFREVIDYANSAVSGKKLACQTERLACQRFLDDYKTSLNDPGYPYQFDFKKAWLVISFLELLPHVKGHFAARIGADRLISLQPWQKFIIANIFGWVRKDNKLRRFRVAYIEVPRKNGKSILAAGIGLYMLLSDGECGAEVYCGATNLKQANEVFSPAKLMVRRTPDLKSGYQVKVREKSIMTPDGSKFEPVIGKPGDGASPSCAIIDEYHEHDTDELYETMITGTGARQQPLILVTTTAGRNLFSPCYDTHKDSVNILRGVYDWQDTFVMIYSLDDGDDWTEESALIKANPNYGISVGSDLVKTEQRKATKKTNKQNAFKTKHLNVWCYAKNAYFNALNWEKCYDPELDINDFLGKTCWIGLDLAKKRDLSAKVVVFKKEIDGWAHYYVFPTFYLPEDSVYQAESDTLQELYSDWLNQGHLETCDGNEMDLRMIRDDVIDDSNRFFVEQVPHDPHGAIAISQELTDAGMVPVVMTQHGSTYTQPIEELEAAIDAGRVHHDGNPVMSWCIANVIVNEYSNGGKMPAKENVENKIDGASALLMALAPAISIPEAQPEPGFVVL